MKFLGVVFMMVMLLISSKGPAAEKCGGAALAKAQRKVESLLLKKLKSQNPWENIRSAFEGRRECMKVYEADSFYEAVSRVVDER